MNINRSLISRLRGARASFIFTILFSVASAVFLILQARLVSRILNQVFIERMPFNVIQPGLWPLIAVILLRAVFHFMGDHFAISTAKRIKDDLRAHLLPSIHGPVVAVDDAHTHSGELTSDLLDGVEALDGYFSQYMPQLILAALIPLLILFTVLPLDLLSAVIMLVTAPLIPLFMILIGKTAEETTRVQWNQMRKMSVHFLDTLQGLMVLKTLNKIGSQIKRIASVSERYRHATMQVLRITFLSSLVLEMVGTLATAIIAVQIGVRLLSGGLEFDTAFFILVIAPDFYQPIRQLGLRFHTGMNAMAVWERVSRWLPAQLSNEFEGRLVSNSGGQPEQIQHFEDLRLTHVSFTYPNRSTEALHEIDLQLAAGEKIALVGASGAGKTTLLNLILGILTPQSGEILINGQPLIPCLAEDWRRLISWVPQKPHLFMGSLWENIALSNPDANAREVMQAVETAGLSALISRLPQGLDTNIGERGTQLSGGEAQRVALARAFLKQGQVLVMDEPTAHLDLQLEHDLLHAIDRLAAGKTVITIAHRLETVRQSDRIYLIEAGRIIQAGNHAKLQQLSAAYRQLLQAGGMA